MITDGPSSLSLPHLLPSPPFVLHLTFLPAKQSEPLLRVYRPRLHFRMRTSGLAMS